MEKDPVVKEKFKSIASEKLPFYLDKLETQVKKNGGYFVRGKVNNFQIKCFLLFIFARI